MPVTVVVGGQFGSEGKGKVAKCLAEQMDASIALRSGGPNSGHTVIDELGRVYIFRQLPTACLLPDVMCVLVAGCYIDLHILFDEIQRVELDPGRLRIDPYAVIITDQIREEEAGSGLGAHIGSTATGTGVAVCKRVDRMSSLTFAKDVPDLKRHLANTKSLLRTVLNNNERVIIEGTQGFGLSLLHSEYYPYVTARDTTAAAFVSEAGISPLDVDDVVLVIRAYPIRVSGNSGPLMHEIDWETVSEESGSSHPIVEYTSVTKKVRRVGRFDENVVLQAIEANSPTRIVLNHLDYIDRSVYDGKHVSGKVDGFVSKVEKLINREVDYIGCSPSDMRKRVSLQVVKEVVSNV